jgi:hypothetical protein
MTASQSRKSDRRVAALYRRRRIWRNIRKRSQKATQRELKAPTGFADRQPAIAKGLSAALASQLTVQRE